MSEPTVELARSEALLDALLSSVSHDLRSPLLAISLSAEMIGQDGDHVAEAIRTLREGAADLERMLAALTSLSSARRREIAVTPVAVGELFSGHLVASDEPDVSSVRVAVDRASVRALVAPLAEHRPVEVRVTVERTLARCEFELESDVPSSPASPLEALAGSLQQYAGTPIEGLAVHELVLSRQGGSLARADERLVVLLPLAG